MSRLLRRLSAVLQHRRLEADLAEELDFHRDMKRRELEDAGMSSNQSGFAARRALGNMALAEDRAHDVWVPHWLQGLGQDVRVAVRMLRSTPLLTTVAVLSLALGIGANIAIFSFVDRLLLRTLPVKQPERLVVLSTSQRLGYRAPYSFATFDQIRQSQLFDGALAFANGSTKSALTIGGETQLVDRFFVSGDFFATLGIPALLGRLFTPADDMPGGGVSGPVMVLSYRLWQERFGGSASVVGMPVTVDRTAVTIIGVTTPEFRGVEVGKTFDVAFPIHMQFKTRSSFYDDEDTPYLTVMLRLKPAQSIAAASAALRAVQPQIRAAAMPKPSNPEFLKDPLTLEPAGAGTSALRQRFERPLVMMFCLVALVLFIVCANLANLQLARGLARHHELSVRLAVGASRWRLARQVLTESLVMAMLGATAGLAFATWAMRALVAQLSTSTTPIALDLSVDWRALAFTATAMVATTLLFGLAPALRATHTAPIDALKEQGRTVSEGRTALSNGLLVIQMALSLALVVAAGLFVRTFEQLGRVTLGFDRDRVLVANVNAQLVPDGDRKRLYHQLVQAVAAVPGVAHAGGSINPPLVGTLFGEVVVSTPGTPPAPDAQRIAQVNSITPGWLSAYGTAIRAGRDIDDHDTSAAGPVMLVNEAFVRRLFPGRDLVGTTLAVTARLPPNGDFLIGSKTVVGIVGDAVYRSIRDPVQPTIYMPLAQWGDDVALPYTNFFMAIQSSTAFPTRLTRSVTAALIAVNPDVSLTFRPLTDQVNDSLVQDRVVAVLSGFFGGLALLLAGLGLYGVTAHAVARRRTEIAIRMALGAAPVGVVRLVLSRVSKLIAVGVVAGAGVMSGRRRSYGHYSMESNRAIR